MWDWSRKTNRCYVSRRLCLILGYEFSDQTRSLLGWARRIHRLDWPDFKNHWRKCLSQRDTFFKVELRLLAADRRSHWLLIRCSLSYQAANGLLEQVIGSASDVTQKRHTAELLADRSEQLNTVFSLSPDAFVVFDADYAIKYANSALDNLLGLNSIDVRGWREMDLIKFINALIEPKDRLDEHMSLEKICQNGSKDGRFMLDVHAGKTRRALLIHLVQSESPSVSQILYLKDITHEHVIEELKSAFLSTAAHELRTPMTSILGFSELLASERPFSAAQRTDALDSIHQEAKRMTQILDDLLDLSTLETRGRAKLNIQEIDLTELVSSVLANFVVPTGRNAPQLRLAPVKARADSDKAYQAFLNILSNAYKYSMRGDVEVSIRVPVDHPGYVELKIADQGLGIADKDQTRLFERFFRVDNSGNIPGTGLGLSIVKEIMTLMRGQVLLNSRLGEGTTVRLLFPI